MLRLPSCFMAVLLAIRVAQGDSQTKGISQFWTDDYKVFEQIYGKTSDKHLYGVTLPPNIHFDVISTPKLAASEKYERYLPTIPDVPSELSDDRYAKLFSKSLYDGKAKASPALQFISFSDFKPISAESDPETYKYLKHLERDNKYDIDLKHFEDDRYTDAPEKGFGDYKSYKQRDADIEEKDAYRSIQDIIDAHEANRGKYEEEDDHTEKRKNKYNNNYYAASKNRNKVRSLNGGIKPSCTSGRCRKRYAPTVSRPYVRKIHYRHN